LESGGPYPAGPLVRACREVLYFPVLGVLTGVGNKVHQNLQNALAAGVYCQIVFKADNQAVMPAVHHWKVSFAYLIKQRRLNLILTRRKRER
jgi:hypothetical protein